MVVERDSNCRFLDNTSPTLQTQWPAKCKAVQSALGYETRQIYCLNNLCSGSLKNSLKCSHVTYVYLN